MIRATIYTGTPTLSVRDNRGLGVRTLNYNRRAAGETPAALIERQLTSDDSRHSQQWDARLFDLWQNDETVLPNLHTRPSLAGQVLRSDSVDAGWSVILYDAAGRVVWAEDGRGTRSRTEFDQLGRPRAAYLQASGEAERVAERYIYGDTDNSMPDPTSYNARGQLVRHYHDAGLQAAPGYSLQGAALREQCQLLPGAEAVGNWQGENESAWQDALAPQVYTTTHEYDALGGALAQTDARGNRQRWSYDVAGLLSQAFLTLSGGSEQILLKQQSWSAAGQKLQETAGNDVVTRYSYEPQTQRLVGIETKRADQTVLQALSYGYDPVGNVVWQDNAAAPTRYFANQAVKARQEYQYDALYQLMSASGRENANAGIQGPALPETIPDTSNLVNYTRSYEYDDGGNLLRIQHTGALSYSNEMVVGSRSNRALAQNVDQPILPEQVDGYFDANGNVLRMQPGTPAGWNECNQLQQVVLVDRGTEQDNDREVYQYHQGLRVRKQTRRLLDSASQRWDIQETLYLPGLELRTRFAEQAGEPQAPSEELHVATPAQGGRAQVRVLHWVVGKPADIANDQVRYGLGDQIGSLQVELDSSGLVISQEEYYPFGGTAVLAARSATEVAYKVVRYTGQERDGTGLYYYGYRYYAPWLGRWLNPDPAGPVDGLNLYRMVRNNPVTFVDTKGLFTTEIYIATAIAAALTIAYLFFNNRPSKLLTISNSNKASAWTPPLINKNHVLVHMVRGNTSDFYQKPAEDALASRDIFSASLIDASSVTETPGGRGYRYTGAYAESGFIIEPAPQNIIATHEQDISFPTHIGKQGAGGRVTSPYQLADAILRPPLSGYSFTGKPWPRIKSYVNMMSPTELLSRKDQAEKLLPDQTVYRNEILVIGKPNVIVHDNLSATERVKVKGIIIASENKDGSVTPNIQDRVKRLSKANPLLPIYKLGHKKLTPVLSKTKTS